MEELPSPAPVDSTITTTSPIDDNALNKSVHEEMLHDADDDTLIQIIDPPGMEFTVPQDEYTDPLTVSRPGKRTIRKKVIFDPSNMSHYVDSIIDRTCISNFHTVHHRALAAQLEAEADNIEGMDPAAYLPEPQSLRSLKHASSLVLKQWLKAFRSELNNHIDKNTFAIPSEYNGEKCLPVTVIYKTKLKSDGMIDKLKVRIAIRGDLDEAAQEEDNGAPLATFRLLKVFLAEAARRRRSVYQSDFVGAYLQAYMDRVVYVKLPKEWAEYFPDLAKWFGVPLLLVKSAYGINSAGRLWA